MILSIVLDISSHLYVMPLLWVCGVYKLHPVIYCVAGNSSYPVIGYIVVWISISFHNNHYTNLTFLDDRMLSFHTCTCNMFLS